jgi:squalene-hopene/tetraprenyl-beta-curcumene cyclase
MRLDDVSPAVGGEVLPTSDGDPRTRALTRGRAHLWSLARPSGGWCGGVEGSPRLDAEYLMLQWFLGRSGGALFTRIAEHLRACERSAGGWADFPGGPPSLDASVEAHLALLLAGDAREAPHLRRARRVIRELGGLSATSAQTKIHLALLGQWEWDDTPLVPPELVLLPPRSCLGLWGLAPWARAILVPISILSARRPVRPVPASVSIEALSRGGAPGRARLGARTYSAVERGLALLDGAPLRPLRRLAVLRAEAWVLERAEPTDGLGGTAPATCAALWALAALGYRLDHPVMVRLLRALDDLASGTGPTSGVLLTRTPVADTALALRVACALPQGAEDPRVTRGVELLLEHEVRRAKDVRGRASGLRPGGWSRRLDDAREPDVETTALVLDVATRLARAVASTAERTLPARQRALQWLLATQTTGGGWGAFEPAATASVLAASPHLPADEALDPPCPAVTGRVLEALATTGLDRRHAAVGRALAFLRRTQAADGAWRGRWGVAWLHGTAHALLGIAAIGEDIAADAAWSRARDWLVRHQRPSGGWGEAASADRAPTFVLGVATATQTAWGPSCVDRRAWARRRRRAGRAVPRRGAVAERGLERHGVRRHRDPGDPSRTPRAVGLAVSAARARGDGAVSGQRGSPRLSAIVARRRPRGCSSPTVVSRAVWCSSSALTSAPSSTTYAEMKSHISRITIAPKAP